MSLSKPVLPSASSADAESTIGQIVIFSEDTHTSSKYGQKVIYENPKGTVLVTIDTSGSMDKQSILWQVTKFCQSLVEEGSILQEEMEKVLKQLTFKVGATPLAEVTMRAIAAKRFSRAIFITDGGNNEKVADEKWAKQVLEESDEVDNKESLIAALPDSKSVKFAADLLANWKTADVLYILMECDSAKTRETINKSIGRRHITVTLKRGDTLTDSARKRVFNGFIKKRSKRTKAIIVTAADIRPVSEAMGERQSSTFSRLAQKVYEGTSVAAPAPAPPAVSLTAAMLVEAMMNTQKITDRSFCEAVVNGMINGGCLKPSLLTSKRNTYKNGKKEMAMNSANGTLKRKAFNSAISSVLKKKKGASVEYEAMWTKKVSSLPALNGTIDTSSGAANEWFLKGKKVVKVN